MSEIVELEAGRLYRIGGRVAVGDLTTWVPPYARGAYPLNCYLVLEEGEALLVDGGVAVFADDLAAQIDELVPVDYDLSIFLTRFELETLTGLEPTLRRRRIKAIYGGSNTSPFDYFDDVSSTDIVRSEYQLPFYGKPPGEPISVGSNGRQLLVLSTTLRLLATYWLYDAVTETMFTSDSFGYAPLPDGDNHPDADPVVFDPSQLIDIGQMREQLLTRFDYLISADVSAVRAGIEKLFGENRTRRIASTYGCVLDGSEVVEVQLSMLYQAMQSLSHGDANPLAVAGWER